MEDIKLFCGGNSTFGSGNEFVDLLPPAVSLLSTKDFYKTSQGNPT